MSHAYGHHDPTTQPRTVTVLGPEKWPREVQVEIPEVLLEQRRTFNELAHQAAHPRRPEIHPPERETFDPQARSKAARAHARHEIEKALQAR